MKLNFYQSIGMFVVLLSICGENIASARSRGAAKQAKSMPQATSRQLDTRNQLLALTEQGNLNSRNQRELQTILELPGGRNDMYPRHEAQLAIALAQDINAIDLYGIEAQLNRSLPFSLVRNPEYDLFQSDSGQSEPRLRWIVQDAQFNPVIVEGTDRLLMEAIYRALDNNDQHLLRDLVHEVISAHAGENIQELSRVMARMQHIANGDNRDIQDFVRVVHQEVANRFGRRELQMFEQQQAKNAAKQTAKSAKRN
jgi:hypothetical protein